MSLLSRTKDDLRTTYGTIRLLYIDILVHKETPKEAVPAILPSFSSFSIEGNQVSISHIFDITELVKEP